MHGCGNCDHIWLLPLPSDVLGRITGITLSCTSGAFISQFPKLFQHLCKQQWRTCLLPSVKLLLLVRNAECWENGISGTFGKEQVQFRSTVCLPWWGGILSSRNSVQKRQLLGQGTDKLWHTTAGETQWLICGNKGFSRGKEWEDVIEGWDIFLVPTTPASEAEEVLLPQSSLQPCNVDIKVITAQWNGIYTS